MTDQERADRIETMGNRLADAIGGEEDYLVIGAAFGATLGCAALASENTLEVLQAAHAACHGVVSLELLT